METIKVKSKEPSSKQQRKYRVKVKKDDSIIFEGGDQDKELLEAWFLFVDDYHKRVDKIEDTLARDERNIYMLVYKSV